MAKRIKVGVRRAFAREFDDEATRRGLRVRREGYTDASSAEYEMDTALGTVRVAADGSVHLLHVYRRFEAVGRACLALGCHSNFNSHSGKWNTWESGELSEEDAVALVARAFRELDKLSED